MPVAPGGDDPNAAPPRTGRKGRRRRPQQAEQARREEWGKTWGQVGRDWKQAHRGER